MTYDDIIELLTKKCDEKGVSTASLGQDFVLMASVEYLRSLLRAAENNPAQRAIIVVLGQDTVKPGDGLLN
jgi:hypothetical protein